MGDEPTPKPKKENLDRKLIKLIGYAPTCLIAGAVLSVFITAAYYVSQYLEVTVDISYSVNQFDMEYDRLLMHLSAVIGPSIFGGCLAGLAIGLVTAKLKNSWQKVLAGTATGAATYLLAVTLWRVVANGSVTDGIDYLRFFALQLSIIGVLVGVFVSFLPQPNTQN